jgi:hypothetical protein
VFPYDDDDDDDDDAIWIETCSNTQCYNINMSGRTLSILLVKGCDLVIDSSQNDNYELNKVLVRQIGTKNNCIIDLFYSIHN